MTINSLIPMTPGQDAADDPVFFANKIRDVIAIDSQQATRFHDLGLPLHRRATQFLWLIHMAVLRERQSRVILPSRLFGQLVWGGRDRPRNWQQGVKATLQVLCEAHDGPALLEKVELNGRQFTIDITPEFLGSLEDCCTETASGVRMYDFSTLMKGEAKQKGKAKEKNTARKTDGEPGEKRPGNVFSASLLTGLFGPANWSGLGRGEQRVLQTLMREVTRSTADKCDRPDKAIVVQGNRVRDIAGKGMIDCTLLSATGRWVTFGGNGKRQGLGYTIFGRTGNGWIKKCGFSTPDDIRERSVPLRQFLGELRNVVKVIGGVVLALEPGTQRWYSLDELSRLAKGSRGAEKVEKLHLRVYAPEDYLSRLRTHFAECGGFAAIPDENSITTTARKAGSEYQPTTDSALRLRIDGMGLTQENLAACLGITRKHFNQLANGRKSWTREMRANLETLLSAAAEEQVA